MEGPLVPSSPNSLERKFPSSPSPQVRKSENSTSPKTPKTPLDQGTSKYPFTELQEGVYNYKKGPHSLGITYTIRGNNKMSGTSREPTVYPVSEKELAALIRGADHGPAQSPTPKDHLKSLQDSLTQIRIRREQEISNYAISYLNFFSNLCMKLAEQSKLLEDDATQDEILKMALTFTEKVRAVTHEYATGLNEAAPSNPAFDEAVAILTRDIEQIQKRNAENAAGIAANIPAGGTRASRAEKVDPASSQNTPSYINLSSGDIQKRK